MHNSYLGKTGMGVAQLILTITVVGALVSAPWAFVQSIFIIMGKIDDADGNPWSEFDRPDVIHLRA